MINCGLFRNSATDGGGVNLGPLINCTVVSNSASVQGGGLWYGSATNCIVYYNTAATGPNYVGTPHRRSDRPSQSKAARDWLEKAIDLAGKKDVRLMALDDPDLQPLWGKISQI